MAKDQAYHLIILNDMHGDSYVVAITDDPWRYKEMHYPGLTESSESDTGDIVWIPNETDEVNITLRAVAVSNKTVHIPISEAMVNRFRGIS